MAYNWDVSWFLADFKAAAVLQAYEMLVSFNHLRNEGGLDYQGYADWKSSI